MNDFTESVQKVLYLCNVYFKKGWLFCRSAKPSRAATQLQQWAANTANTIFRAGPGAAAGAACTTRFWAVARTVARARAVAWAEPGPKCPDGVPALGLCSPDSSAAAPHCCQANHP